MIFKVGRKSVPMSLEIIQLSKQQLLSFHEPEVLKVQG